jgi:tripartite-type tricarboxylate transporter receptor subunit TctC
MRSNVPFDPVKDFSPITLVTTSPLVVVVHSSVAASSVKELIALAKAKPGTLNYGSGNAGSSSHLGVELFKSMAGVDVVRIPYKGVGFALNALITGESQMMIASAGSAMGHVKSGRLKALASTGAKPSSLLPGLPTVAASGLPGYEFAQTLGALAPAKTPVVIVNRLNREIAQVLEQQDVKQKLFGYGVEAVSTSPAEFGAMIKSDMSRLGKVIRDAGIHEE